MRKRLSFTWTTIAASLQRKLINGTCCCHRDSCDLVTMNKLQDHDMVLRALFPDARRAAMRAARTLAPWIPTGAGGVTTISAVTFNGISTESVVGLDESEK
jgi:hypothetical protein